MMLSPSIDSPVDGLKTPVSPDVRTHDIIFLPLASGNCSCEGAVSRAQVRFPVRPQFVFHSGLQQAIHDVNTKRRETVIHIVALIHKIAENAK